MTKKTRGQRLADKNRAKYNKLSRAERDRLLKVGLALIYGKPNP